MNLIFTCGGTAGHINPAIAVANMMRERHPDCNILFIGAKGHMEEKLVPQAGYDLKCLEGSGLSRGKNLTAVKKNLHAVKCVREGVKACKKIFREFKPDVVIGTGGYASYPVVKCAAGMGWLPLRKASATTSTRKRWRLWGCLCAESSFSTPKRARGRSWA